MEAHYYRREIVDRLSKSIPEEEKRKEVKIHDGEKIDVQTNEELAEFIYLLLESAIKDNYNIGDIFITIDKKNKRRIKRQYISVFNWNK